MGGDGLMTLRLTLRGVDEWMLMRQLVTQGLAAGETTRISYDFEARELRSDWLDHYPTCLGRRDDLNVSFGEDIYLATKKSGDTPGRAVLLVDDTRPPSLDDLLEVLPRLSFRIGVGGPIHRRWTAPSLGLAEAPRAGFGEGNDPHGWAAFFKSDGHDQIAHRRVLEHGPWRTLRADNDVTLVQFHDLDADPETALIQAMPGHHLLGYAEDRAGTFFHRETHPIAKAWSGLYDPDSKELIVTVPPGGPVTRKHMLDTAWKRFAMNQKGEKPVDRVAWVFIDEQDALEHAPRLWLRGFDVRAFAPAGHEYAIDEEYAAAFPKPDWVKRVQDREGR